jgi:protein-tyrosine phosphatase
MKNNLLKFYEVIANQLFAGETISSLNLITRNSKMKQIFDLGITTIINLTEENEINFQGAALVSYDKDLIEFYEKSNKKIELIKFPIQDGNIPDKSDLNRLLEIIRSKIQLNEKIYIHCRGGIGRTGVIIGSILIDLKLVSKNDVLLKINDLKKKSLLPKRQSPETDKQIKFLIN